MNCSQTSKFAAMLLFQFRTVKDGVSNFRRVCEERIVIFEAANADDALRMAKNRGVEEELSYEDRGFQVFLEFVGVLDLVELDITHEPDEVWSRLYEKVMPMERRDEIIPDEDNLYVFRSERKSNRKRVFVPEKCRLKKT